MRLNCEFDFKGMNAFIKQLKGELYDEVKKTMIDFVGDVSSIAKAKTPVDTGLLRNSWKRTGVMNGKVEIYNNTEYANYVEYGHRTRNGGYVKGRKMLHRSIVGMRSQFARNARIILRNLTND